MGTAEMLTHAHDADDNGLSSDYTPVRVGLKYDHVHKKNGHGLSAVAVMQMLYNVELQSPVIQVSEIDLLVSDNKKTKTSKRKWITVAPAALQNPTLPSSPEKAAMRQLPLICRILLNG